MQAAPVPGDTMKFTVVPANIRDSVTKDIKIVNSEKLVGYNMMLGGKESIEDAGSDYYNVTVNMVIKRGSAFAA